MTLYAQHGAQKSDYIHEAIQKRLLSGVILSPRDERPDRISIVISEMRREGRGIDILFDPQFYASVLSERNDRHLPDYSQYYRYPLTRANFSAREIQAYCDSCITFQLALGIDKIIAPSVHFAHFSDPWSQISLSMSQEASDYKRSLELGKSILASIILDEKALCDTAALDDYLNALTMLDVDGFYLIVQCESDRYPAKWDEIALENFLYLVYVLAELNGYLVLCGYCDVIGVPATAVGASAVASGWHNTLRQFSLSRFMPSTGGRRGRARYSTDALMNSVLLVPELLSIRELGLLGDVAARTPYDDILLGSIFDVDAWSQRRSFLHHWSVLERMLRVVRDAGDIRARCNYAEQMLMGARDLYRYLASEGVTFESSSGVVALESWLAAFGRFRERTGI